MENIKKIAIQIVESSLNIQRGEKVFIKYKNSILKPLVKEVILAVYERGAIPYVKMEDIEIKNILQSQYSQEGVELLVYQRQFEIEKFDASISLGYKEDLPSYPISPEFKKAYSKRMSELGLTGKGPKKWVLFNYPSKESAIQSNMGYDKYQKIYLNAVFYDYKKLRKDCVEFQNLLNKTKKIRIIAPGTDLTFYKNNIPSVLLTGEHNLPDGELYTAPIKNSVNGKITYNVATIRDNHYFKNITLYFKDGKVIDFNVDGDIYAFESFLNMDEGARYVGEFAFGLNNNLFIPVIDTLCDEKIAGSIHLALGNCYKNTNNGNVSSLHWDMIRILRSEYGGGEVYFDDVLVQKDGLFVQNVHKALNYDERIKE